MVRHLPGCVQIHSATKTHYRSALDRQAQPEADEETAGGDVGWNDRRAVSA
jgi:hypothetical protein